MAEIEVLDAAELVGRLSEGELTEHDRLLIYRGGLLMAAEELMRLHGESVDIDYGVLSVIRDIFQNLDEYESGVVLAHTEEAEDLVEAAEDGELGWESTDPTEPISS
jgi:hypothetical protein